MALFCFAFLPEAQAVVPAPDGGYAGFTTAEGQNALLHLSTGTSNTAVGWSSLESVTIGNVNTGVGAGTLALNTGSSNTAVGGGALLNNTTCVQNTANGALTLISNTEGSFNTAVGHEALYGNTTGQANSAFGNEALGNLVSGYGNTAIGSLSGTNLFTGSGNVYIGEGIAGHSTQSNRTYIRNINTTTTTVSGGGADTVTVNLSSGLPGHLSSSRRYKENIKPMENASQTLYRLKPVIYHYKKEIDPSQSLDYGLVAEEVAKVDPNLATRNRDGQIESVRYSAINVMLLNEFLKEHKKMKEFEATVARQAAAIAKQQKDFQATATHQQKQIEALTAGLQKVSAEVEASKPSPQAVNNP